jgi:cell division protein ZapA (FtsZ GTPase activity inhibitor)
MAKENVIQFTLEGVDYALRGDMSKERLEQVVRHVEDKVVGIRQQQPYYSAVKTHALAALQLAAELLDEKDKCHRLEAAAKYSQQAQQRQAVLRSSKD